VILDYNPATGAYWLRVPRGATPDAQTLMTEYGLDFSEPASTYNSAVLFTRDPYCAVSFREGATPAARQQLDWIIREVEASWAPSSDRHVDCPPGRELWPYQRADVDYLMRRPHGLDADEPGLGKTMVAICVANEMQAKRVLVVCPASIRLQWAKRIREWSTLDRPRVYAITASRYGTSERAEYSVVSFDLARRPPILRALVKQEYDLLVIDEAHYCKEVSSKRTRAIFGYHDRRPDDGESETVVTACLAERSKRVLCLTGTPLPNRPREAYVMARGLCWDAIDWLSQRKFAERYNPMRKTEVRPGKVFVQERQGRLPELQNRMRAHFMCRHLKREVLPQLKLPIYDLIQVEETSAVKQALAAERLLDIDPEMLAGADAQILGQVSTVRRMMGVALAPQVADYIAMLIEGGENKLVVFAHHVEVLDILCERLHEYGVVRVDGSDTARSKDTKVRAFVERPEIRVIVGNILSLGTGTDGLQIVCNHGLIAEPDWVPGNNVQCGDRLDRGGQRETVQIDIFVAPGSIAERILATALRKGGVIHKSLDMRASEIV